MLIIIWSLKYRNTGRAEGLAKNAFFARINVIYKIGRAVIYAPERHIIILLTYIK